MACKRLGRGATSTSLQKGQCRPQQVEGVMGDTFLEAEGKGAVGSSSIPGSGVGSAGVLERLLMPAARSKRCRQARPLTQEGRLAERERPAGFSGSSMQDQVALGAKRSPSCVKGGIARAAG
jgi:hypothetical protein